MNRNIIKKTFIENYKQYYIYKIIDAHGRIIFNAESPYLEEGNVTFVAKSTNEIYKCINNKIKQIQSFRKAKILR